MIDISVRFWHIDKNMQMDIRVDEGQRIEDTIKILREQGAMPPAERTGYVTLHGSQKHVSIKMTYRQAGIYSGDILQM